MSATRKDGPRAFRFRPILTIFTLIALAILISLGTWQLQRRAWKLDLIAKTEARLADTPIPLASALEMAKRGIDMEYAPVTISGEYVHAAEAPVAGIYGGAPGFYVFTPLKTLSVAPIWGEGNVVYVNRGFVPTEKQAPSTREQGRVSGDVAVVGLLRAAETPGGLVAALRPADVPAENRWYTRDPRLFAEWSGFATGPYYIDSSGAETPGEWPKGGVTRVEFNNRHLEYALTWYGLAAALIGVYVAFSLRRESLADG